jgi:predicted hydrocarbon binding protein
MQGSLVGAIIDRLTALLPNNVARLDDFPRIEELEAIEGSKFYPVSLFVDLAAYVEARLDSREEMLNLGRSFGSAIIGRYLGQMKIHSVDEAIKELNDIYQAWSRNVYGAWEIQKRLSAGNRQTLVISYTWPYNCALQEGILLEIARVFGGLFPEVTHSQCMRDGDPQCVYELSWTIE